jgi:hypothetical protein
MDKAGAITRINEGLGFRSLSADIITRRLVEAQRDLERGKTLPPFLISEDTPLTLIQGSREIALPDDFIREVDDGCTWTPKFGGSSVVLIRKPDLNSLLILDVPTEPGSPLYYVIRSQSLYFGRYADQTYTLEYSYYAHAGSLLTLDENAWTLDPSGFDWLVGFAGRRLAMDLRAKAAVEVFMDMETRARAALFGEIVVQDDIPLAVGSNL